MAIDVVELFENRSGRRSVSGARTYTRSFQATTDDPALESFQVLDALAAEIPGNSAYPFDPGAFARDYEASQGEDPCDWKMTIGYAVYDPETAQADPLDNRPEVEWNFAKTQVPVDVDAEGDAVVNSAGDPFDPPVMRDRSRPVCTITRNEAAFNSELAAQYTDKVNAATFLGYAAGRVKCSNISASRAFHPVAGLYWRVRYEFEVRDLDEGWQARVLDQGMREVVSGKLVAMFDDSGLPATAPMLLNGSGGKLAAGGTPAFREFTIYPEADLAALDLE